jgi:hypothetical protein
MSLQEQCLKELGRIEAELTEKGAHRIAHAMFEAAREGIAKNLDSKLANLIINSMLARGEQRNVRN